MILHPHKPAHLVGSLSVALRGHALLTSPRFNKGTAFPLSERKAFGLEGRLPYRVNTLDEQCDRAYGQLMQRDSPLRKNTFLQSLKDQNWTLYYALLSKHLKELVPIIYTPTQAEAIENYSQLFRRSEGLYLSYPDRHRMEVDFLEQIQGRDLDLIVCTDSEAILGIGDQGVGGIGIATAKSVMYTLLGGLDPAKSLSVVLDVGTNNQKLLNDPLYVGWQEKRIRGEEYDKFIDKFVQLVHKYLPHSLLHFEDFGVTNAHRILDKYHDAHAVFNDDIQGTGAVTLAYIMAAIDVSRRSRAATLSSSSSSSTSISQDLLAEQRYVILGAGSAGMGIAVQLRDAIMAADGISRQDANRRFWLVDREGLLYEKEGGKAVVDKARGEFFRPAEEGWGKETEPVKAGVNGQSNVSTQAGYVGLLEVVKKARPTVLIGCSTCAGAFNQNIMEAMMAGLEEGVRPIILALSNPSRLAEAKPADLLHWTKGKALVATGSPFDDVKMEVEGKEVVFQIAGCNNALIYPGLGLGAILAQSKCMTDTMLIAGAKTLAGLSPAITKAIEHEKSVAGKSAASAYEYEGEALLPDFNMAPGVNFEVGVAVAEQAVREGSAGVRWQGQSHETVREKVREKVWVPIYPKFVYDEKGLRDL